MVDVYRPAPATSLQRCQIYRLLVRIKAKWVKTGCDWLHEKGHAYCFWSAGLINRHHVTFHFECQHAPKINQSNRSNSYYNPYPCHRTFNPDNLSNRRHVLRSRDACDVTKSDK